MKHSQRLGPRDALLAALILGMPVSAPAAPKDSPPSMRNSFRIGTTGLLCTAQSRTTGPNLVNMFDREYWIVCQGATTPVGRLYALRSGKDDPIARVAKNSETPLQCGAPTSVGLGRLAAVRQRDCVETTSRRAHKSYSYAKGGIVYIADGLGDYDGALQLALQTMVADAIVEGEVRAATISADDPPAFARLQAEALDSGGAWAEGDSRSREGCFAEASEYFKVLVERDPRNDTPERLSEYLANQALAESSQHNFLAADALFVRASTPAALADPVVGRTLRNFHAIHDLNQDKVEEAIDELSKPISPVQASKARDVKPTIGEIDGSIADSLNRERGMAEITGLRAGSFQTSMRVKVLDIQALQVLGVAYRVDRAFAKARETFAREVSAIRAVEGGGLDSSGFVRTCIQGELAQIAEAEGKYDEAEREYADAAEAAKTRKPGTATSLIANARFAGFLARHGQVDRALKIYDEIIPAAKDIPCTTDVIGPLMRSYHLLRAARSAMSPRADIPDVSIREIDSHGP